MTLFRSHRLTTEWWSPISTSAPGAGRDTGAHPIALFGLMVLRTSIPLLLLTGMMAAQTEEKKAPGLTPSRWTQIEAAIGMVNLDGTLRLSFPLGTSVGLKQLGIRFELQHRIETDADGRACSEWRVRGLQSTLAPAGRAQLRWQPLAGAAVNFERAKIGRALADAGSAHWLIREPAAGEYEIRSMDGLAWRYRQGTLAGAEHPALGPLRFFTQGAWITRIEQTDGAAGGAPLLQARYDDSGRLVSWQVGREKPQQLIWSEEGHLTGWQQVDGGVVRFTYRDNLLCGVAEPGKPPRLFTWRENPGYGRGDSRWVAPVHLASNGTDTYAYELTSRGFTLVRQENVTGRETRTTFNPRRHRLEQRANGESFMVTFRSGIASRGALERIEMAGGEILEEYHYDEHGLLVSMKHKGDPLVVLSYDEIGRLIGLESEKIQ